MQKIITIINKVSDSILKIIKIKIIKINKTGQWSE